MSTSDAPAPAPEPARVRYEPCVTNEPAVSGCPGDPIECGWEAAYGQLVQTFDKIANRYAEAEATIRKLEAALAARGAEVREGIVTELQWLPEPAHSQLEWLHGWRAGRTDAERAARGEQP